MNIIIRNIRAARCILYCNLCFKCVVANCSWQIETETSYYNIITRKRERERERLLRMIRVEGLLFVTLIYNCASSVFDRY